MIKRAIIFFILSLAYFFFPAVKDTVLFINPDCPYPNLVSGVASLLFVIISIIIYFVYFLKHPLQMILFSIAFSFMVGLFKELDQWFGTASFWQFIVLAFVVIGLPSLIRAIFKAIFSSRSNDDDRIPDEGMDFGDLED